MGRREDRQALESTWTFDEPQKAYESRAQRRKNLALARREASERRRAVMARVPLKGGEGAPVSPSPSGRPSMVSVDGPDPDDPSRVLITETWGAIE